MLVKPDANGNVAIGDVEIPVALLTSLTAIEGKDGVTAKALKLQDARVQFKAIPNGMESPAEYTVSLVVSRTPVTSAEVARVEVKEALQKQNKLDKEAKAEATIERSVSRAVEAERNAAKQVVAIAENTTRLVAQTLAGTRS